MRNIGTFQSKQMYLYLSLVEQKVTECSIIIWVEGAIWIFGLFKSDFHHCLEGIHGVLMTSSAILTLVTSKQNIDCWIVS